MWKHVVAETTFWGHKRIDAANRFRHRGRLEEQKHTERIQNELKNLLNVEQGLFRSCLF